MEPLEFARKLWAQMTPVSQDLLMQGVKNPSRKLPDTAINHQSMQFLLSSQYVEPEIVSGGYVLTIPGYTLCAWILQYGDGKTAPTVPAKINEDVKVGHSVVEWSNGMRAKCSQEVTEIQPPSMPTRLAMRYSYIQCGEKVYHPDDTGYVGLRSPEGLAIWAAEGRFRYVKID